MNSLFKRPLSLSPLMWTNKNVSQHITSDSTLLNYKKRYLRSSYLIFHPMSSLFTRPLGLSRLIWTNKDVSLWQYSTLLQTKTYLRSLFLTFHPMNSLFRRPLNLSPLIWTNIFASFSYSRTPLTRTSGCF